MTTTTVREEAVLLAALTNEFQAEGEDAIENPVWSDCFYPGEGYLVSVNTKQFPGVCSSLCKKGLLESDGPCLWLTKEGYEKASELFEKLHSTPAAQVEQLPALPYPVFQDAVREAQARFGRHARVSSTNPIPFPEANIRLGYVERNGTQYPIYADQTAAIPEGLE